MLPVLGETIVGHHPNGLSAAEALFRSGVEFKGESGVRLEGLRTNGDDGMNWASNALLSGEEPGRVSGMRMGPFRLRIAHRCFSPGVPGVDGTLFS